MLTLPTPAAVGAFLLRNWLPALLALIIIGQYIYINGVGIWPLKIPGLQSKYDTAINKLVEARNELERISSAKNEQRETTKGNIRESEKQLQIADKTAREIEAAPLPENCVTPKSGEDLL